MATYFITGTGNSLFDAYSGGVLAPLAGRLIYVTSNEFGFENADGSVTYVNGSGFVFDAVAGNLTAGSVTALRHYDADGAYIDDIKNFATPVAVTALQAALEASATSDTGALANLLLSGNDQLNATFFKGTEGGVTLNGLAGNDTIYGSALADILTGDRGKDTIFGNAGNDLIFGGNGNDKIIGGGGADTIHGDATGITNKTGNDRVAGGAGNDTIDGGRGNDVIRGGAGADFIAGGIAGDDRLAGGTGADTFFFSFSGDGIRPVGGEWGNDIILDFEVGVDQLILSDMLSRPLTLGNDANGNAVIRVDADNTITLFGIDANTVSINDLLLI